MAWFRRDKHKDKNNKERTEGARLKIPEGLWVKCNHCKEIIYKKEVEKNWNVCPKCDYHFRIRTEERLRIIYDEGKYEEFNTDLQPCDPLSFKDVVKYKDRLLEHQRRTGLNDAAINCEGHVGDHPLIISALEFDFMGGSMASVVGEKLSLAIERSVEKHCAFMSIASSGGARMQEGIISLMQMAKTSAVTVKLADEGLPFISLLTDPTMGGVSASFAMLGDVILAEPKALVGFAGPRVIEQTIGKPLPEGFQRAEFLLEHGMVDSSKTERSATVFNPSPGFFLRAAAYKN